MSMKGNRKSRIAVTQIDLDASIALVNIKGARKSMNLKGSIEKTVHLESQYESTSIKHSSEDIEDSQMSELQKMQSMEEDSMMMSARIRKQIAASIDRARTEVHEESRWQNRVLSGVEEQMEE